ncbi:Hypothetical protein NTJ_03908 [Nesidiocoris tenuis]|uniref:Uncharacterized protein n=1 Tax=Nesidiocoris tenuis TaxID=355587 RepID=A0ABN7AFP0_9HEMI|nr:Hypothetical protein NTJ_03908 [Nesidiocoris tenuis]
MRTRLLSTTWQGVGKRGPHLVCNVCAEFIRADAGARSPTCPLVETLTAAYGKKIGKDPLRMARRRVAGRCVPSVDDT